MKKKKASSIKGAGITGCWHNGRMQIDPYLSHCTKLKSKWIKDLNITPVTLILKEKKVESILGLNSTGFNCLNITLVAQTLRSTTNKCDLLKLKSFCKTKDTINKTKWQLKEYENIFTNPTSDRGLISKIYTQETRHQNI